MQNLDLENKSIKELKELHVRVGEALLRRRILRARKALNNVDQRTIHLVPSTAVVGAALELVEFFAMKYSSIYNQPQVVERLEFIEYALELDDDNF